ncbi:28509_t:CDS:2, partial [Racocetra persica]
GVWEVTKFGAKLAGAAAVGTAIVATGGAAVPFDAAVVAEGFCISQAVKSAADEGLIDENGVVSELGEIVGESLMGGGGDAIIEKERFRREKIGYKKSGEEDKENLMQTDEISQAEKKEQELKERDGIIKNLNKQITELKAANNNLAR